MAHGSIFLSEHPDDVTDVDLLIAPHHRQEVGSLLRFSRHRKTKTYLLRQCKLGTPRLWGLELQEVAVHHEQSGELHGCRCWRSPDEAIRHLRNFRQVLQSIHMLLYRRFVPTTLGT